MVRVLDEDPELCADLAAEARESARASAVASVIRVAPQPWSYLIDEEATRGHLGLLILEGLIARHMRFGSIGSTEFLGPRDVIRPWRRPASRTHSISVEWEVLSPARIAELDRDFAIRITPWPEITGALAQRGSVRADSQVLQSALRQAVRVEDRLLIALWHFAERWGAETRAGWTIDIPRLTGEILAKIVGARRQSVSTALGQLADRRAIRRTGSGSWIICERPPQLDHVEVGHRASDEVPHLRLTAEA